MEAILISHGIETRYNEDGNLMALDVYTYDNGTKVHTEWINTHGWSASKLYRWLGY